MYLLIFDREDIVDQAIIFVPDLEPDTIQTAHDMAADYLDGRGAVILQNKFEVIGHDAQYLPTERPYVG